MVLQGRDLTRERIRIRDNHTCRKCGKEWQEGTRRFDVHHKDCDPSKTKGYDIYEEEKDNLITLCHKCHLNIPKHRKRMGGNRKTKNKRLYITRAMKIKQFKKAGMKVSGIASEMKISPSTINRMLINYKRSRNKH